MSKSGLALRRISGHCTVTADKIYAWYLLDPQGWSFRPDSVREQLIIDGADTYAQLVKRSIHIRVTTRPYPVSRWAADHDANAPAPLPGWRDYLMTDQRHLSGRSMADKEVYVGVEIPARKGLYKALGGLAGSLSDREVLALSNQIRATDEIMASPGMDGAPPPPAARVAPPPILLPRPAGPAHPRRRRRRPLGGRGPARVHRPRRVVRHPLRPHHPRDRRNENHRVERHVCVLSVGRMTDLEIPAGIPWMQRTDRSASPSSGLAESRSRTRPRSAWPCAATSRRSGRRRTTTSSSTTSPRQARWTARPRRRSPSRTRSRWGSRACRPEPLAGTGWRFRARARRRPSSAPRWCASSTPRRSPSPARPTSTRWPEFIPGEKLGSTAYKRRMPVDPGRRRSRRHREGG